MDYTSSTGYATHAGTGKRLHSEAQAVPTVWSEKDANQIIWSLMKLVEAGGQTAAAFDPAVPGSYSKVANAVVALIASAIAAQVLTAGGVPAGLRIGSLLVQWGRVASSNVTISLPYAYANSNYMVITGNADSQGTYADVAFGYPASASSLFVATKQSYNPNSITNFPVYWVTFGQGA